MSLLPGFPNICASSPWKPSPSWICTLGVCGNEREQLRTAFGQWSRALCSDTGEHLRVLCESCSWNSIIAVAALIGASLRMAGGVLGAHRMRQNALLLLSPLSVASARAALPPVEEPGSCQRWFCRVAHCLPQTRFQCCYKAYLLLLFPNIKSQ